MVKKQNLSTSQVPSSSMYAASTTSQSQTTSANATDDDDNNNNNASGNASQVASNDQLSKKDSMDELDQRTPVEKELFEAVEELDFDRVDEIVNEHKADIDLNHKDLHRHDLLTEAVYTGNLEMVIKVLKIDEKDRKMLLLQGCLHAIKENKLSMVKAIIDAAEVQAGKQGRSLNKTLSNVTPQSVQNAQSVQRTSSKGSQSGKKKVSQLNLKGNLDESDFGHDITPMMMAASTGHYEIMQFLHEKNLSLPLLHFPSCSCSVCKNATRDLGRTKTRIHLLKAMANPYYLIFMAGIDGTFDPVYESFQLLKDIKQCVDEEPEFEEEYMEIYKELEKFPLKMLDLCRSAEETKVFLSQKQGYVGPDSMPFPRLAVAIEMDRKDIVAHPNIQFLIQSEFHGPYWKNTPTEFDKAFKFVVTLLVTSFFPFVQLYLWFALFCCTKLPCVKYLLSPRMKSWSKLGSYAFFCIALFCMNKEERSEADIEPPTMYVRWVVVVYVLALLLALLRRFMLHPGAFWKSGWNYFDLVTQILFWISFGIWIYLFIRKSELGFEETLPRRKMKMDDPLLLEECAFALASVCATLRLLRWNILHSFLGPLQAGFYRMAKSQKTFALLILWCVGTFSISSTILLRPYKNLTKYDDKDLKMKEQPTDMMSFPKLLVHYFVGEIGPDQVEIFKVNRTFIKEDGKEERLENEHDTTQLFMTFLCGVWNVVAIAFFKDALTGQFGASGADVFEAKDKEWKYDRAKEMLYYILDGNLAPPFNLLPNGDCMSNVCGWISTMTCKKKEGKREAGCNCTECCWLKDVESPDEALENQAKYPVLMRKLFQRSLKHLEEDDDEKATKGDVESVHDIVKQVRAYVKELLGLPPSKQGSNENGGGGGGGGGDTDDGSSRSRATTPGSTVSFGAPGGSSTPARGATGATTPKSQNTTVTPTRIGTKQDMVKSSVEVMMTPKKPQGTTASPSSATMPGAGASAATTTPMSTASLGATPTGIKPIGSGTAQTSASVGGTTAVKGGTPERSTTTSPPSASRAVSKQDLAQSSAGAMMSPTKSPSAAMSGVGTSRGGVPERGASAGTSPMTASPSAAAGSPGRRLSQSGGQGAPTLSRMGSQQDLAKSSVEVMLTPKKTQSKMPQSSATMLGFHASPSGTTQGRNATGSSMFDPGDISFYK